MIECGDAPTLIKDCFFCSRDRASLAAGEAVGKLIHIDTIFARRDNYSMLFFRKNISLVCNAVKVCCVFFISLSIMVFPADNVFAATGTEQTRVPGFSFLERSFGAAREVHVMVQNFGNDFAAQTIHIALNVPKIIRAADETVQELGHGFSYGLGNSGAAKEAGMEYAVFAQASVSSFVDGLVEGYKILNSKVEEGLSGGAKAIIRGAEKTLNIVTDPF